MTQLFLQNSSYITRVATPLVMQSGSVLSANFRLLLQPARRIRGTVTGMTLFRNATFELFDSQGNQVSTRAVLSGSGGSFQLLDVLAGTYTVRVRQGDGPEQVSGEGQITVGETGGDGLTIALKPGVEVKTIIDCRPADEREAKVSCGATLSLYRSSGLPLLKNVSKKDSSLSNLIMPAGSYNFQTKTFNSYVKEILIGGRPLRPNDQLEIFEGMPPVEIQTAVDGGNIDAKLDLPGLEKTPAVQMLVVPLFDSYAGPSLIQGDVGGYFQLAPGEYQVYAFPASSFQNVEYRNPEALRAFPPVGIVRVEENGHHQVTIKSLSQ